MSQSAVRVQEELRGDILGGRCEPGSRLREEELAERFGLSRTPVREALRRLEADGLVTVTPRRGAEVVRWRDDDLAELVELRALLEGHAARRAAVGGGVDLVALTELCARMEAEAPPGTEPRDGADEITRLNMELHRAVHRAGGKLLPDLLARLIDVPVVRRTFHTYSDAELRRSFAQHRELVDALAAGDGDWAAAVMQAHIRAAGATLRARRAPDPDPGYLAGTPGRPTTAAADRRNRREDRWTEDVPQRPTRRRTRREGPEEHRHRRDRSASRSAVPGCGSRWPSSSSRVCPCTCRPARSGRSSGECPTGCSSASPRRWRSAP